MPARDLAIVAALVAAVSLAACQSQRPVRAPCPAGERCLEYGNNVDPNSLDPQLAQTVPEANVLRELFEGLYADGADGSPVLGAAESVTTSADGLIWTFQLRAARWSDGAPLTAGDFVFAYRRMLDPKTGSAYAYLLYLLKNGKAVNEGAAPPEALGAKAIDDRTLELTLAHPAPYLPQLLKHQAYFPVPAHVVRRWGEAWVKPGRLVGDGAYRLTGFRLGDYVRIEKNPFWRGAGGLCFDRVDFYPTTDQVAAERRVLRGELDVNAGVQPNRVRRLRANPLSAPYVRSHPYLLTSYLIFNRRDVAPLKDVRVRQAISMAIDRAFVTDKLLGAGQIPTASFVPGGIAGYLPAGDPHPAPYWAAWPYARREEEARRLLAAAGYGPGRPLRLELKTTNAAGSLLYGQSMQADLKAVGVDLTFRQEDGIVVFESFNVRDFQLGTAGWVADYDDPGTFLNLLKSDTGAQNYGDYRNPAYDALLNEADWEPDGPRRAHILARAEQMALDDAVVGPIFTGVNLNLVNPHVTGWIDNDADIHPIRLLCLDDAGRPERKAAADR